MNLSEWKFYFDIGQSLVLAALAVTVWLRKPGEDASRAVASLRSELFEHMGRNNARLIAVETEMRTMPSDAELIRLEGVVKGVDVRTEGLSEAVATIRTQLNRIENYLLTQK